MNAPRSAPQAMPETLLASLRGLLAIYAVLFRTTLAVQFQYRASLVIWLIGTVLEPVILLVVWTTVAREQGGSVNGMSAGDFAAYFIVGMVVNQLTFAWIMWEYEYYIREGTLSAWLLRPLHPIHRDITDNISYKMLTGVVLVPTVAVLVWIFKPAFALSLWSTVAALPALLLAFALRFVLEWTLAMAAFWTTRISAVNGLYYVAFLFFSGRLAPLALFPAAVVSLSLLLPFRWTLAFPIELFLGRLSGREALAGFGAQLLWLLVALLLQRFVWRRALRHFAAVGG